MDFRVLLCEVVRHINKLTFVRRSKLSKRKNTNMEEVYVGAFDDAIRRCFPDQTVEILQQVDCSDQKLDRFYNINGWKFAVEFGADLSIGGDISDNHSLDHRVLEQAVKYHKQLSPDETWVICWSGGPKRGKRFETEYEGLDKGVHIAYVEHTTLFSTANVHFSNTDTRKINTLDINLRAPSGTVAQQQNKVLKVEVLDADDDIVPFDACSFEQLLERAGECVKGEVTKVKYDGRVIKSEESFQAMVNQNGQRKRIEVVKKQL
ncbi:hypothetical protein AKO1_000935 [Acrasis kona]|uniref:Uncharacterized protein n=1 Tax=Acrasis kona TaxID=1008807 RepID=A0AAW2ZTN8_9EUKA